MLSLLCVLIHCDCDKTVLFELMITCTGLWLTCFVLLFLYALLKFSAAAFEWLAFIAFKKCFVQLCASRKTSAGLWLSHCFLWKLKRNFPFAVSFLYYKIGDFECDEIVLFDWWSHALGSDWVLVVILFLYIWLFTLPRLLSSGLLLLLSKLYANLCLKETLGFEWVFVFWRSKTLDFL